MLNLIFMKRNKYLYNLLVATVLFTSSCTDFDDYNTAYKGMSLQSTQTLWNNITENKELSQFSDVIKKAGYDKELQSTRFFTIWAPLNDTFPYDSLMNDVDSVSLVNKFLKSHIANYNFILSESECYERVHALNKKSFTLKGVGGAYTYDNNLIMNRNIPSVNGVMHLIEGTALYLPNIYESLSDTLNLRSYEIDSIRNFIIRYEKEELDRDNSIEGAIDANGNQTYIDSVMIISNTMLGRNYLNAALENEDSSYTLLLPTNAAYIDAYEKIKKLYNYPATLNFWEVTKEIPDPSSSVSRNKDSQGKTFAELGDSLAHRYIYVNSVFNNNNRYNRWVYDSSDPNMSDTIYTTQGRKLSNGSQFISHYIGIPEKMSNGYIRVLDTLALVPWETYNPILSVNIHSSKYNPVVKAATAKSRTLYDTEVDTLITRYLDLEPGANSSATEAYFYVDGVRSTTYNVVVVFVASDSLTGAPKEYNYLRQYKFSADINFADANGNVTKITSPTLKFKNKASTNFITEIPDSVLLYPVQLGQVTFPVSYANVPNCYPLMKIKSTVSSWNKTEWKKYDNRLRIAGIYFVPVEYDMEKFLSLYK